MSRRQPHEFDPRRSGANTGGRRDYHAGYQAGRAGGVPPGRKGCPLLLLGFAAVPTGLALAGWAVGAAWGVWS